MAMVGNSITATQVAVMLWPVWIVSTGASWCGAFPPVDGFCAGGYAVEDASDELGMAAPAAGEAELVEFSGGAVVVVNRLIHGAGVDLAVPVEVDRRRAASRGLLRAGQGLDAVDQLNAVLGACSATCPLPQASAPT